MLTVERRVMQKSSPQQTDYRTGESIRSWVGGYTVRLKTANDPKLSDRDPEARVCARRGEAKARHVPGFMAGAHAVTEPVELRAARR